MHKQNNQQNKTSSYTLYKYDEMKGVRDITSYLKSALRVRVNLSKKVLTKHFMRKAIDWKSYINIISKSRISDYAGYLNAFINSKSFVKLHEFNADFADYAGWLFICLFDWDTERSSRDKENINRIINQYKALKSAAEKYKNDSQYRIYPRDLKEASSLQLPFPYKQHVGLTIAVSSYKYNWLDEPLEDIAQPKECTRGISYLIGITKPKNIVENKDPKIEVVHSPFTMFRCILWDTDGIALNLLTKFFIGSFYCYVIQMSEADNFDDKIKPLFWEIIKQYEKQCSDMNDAFVNSFNPHNGQDFINTLRRNGAIRNVSKISTLYDKKKKEDKDYKVLTFSNIADMHRVYQHWNSINKYFLPFYWGYIIDWKLDLLDIDNPALRMKKYTMLDKEYIKLYLS